MYKRTIMTTVLVAAIVLLMITGITQQYQILAAKKHSNNTPSSTHDGSKAPTDDGSKAPTDDGSKAPTDDGSKAPSTTTNDYPLPPVPQNKIIIPPTPTLTPYPIPPPITDSSTTPTPTPTPTIEDNSSSGSGSGSGSGSTSDGTSGSHGSHSNSGSEKYNGLAQIPSVTTDFPDNDKNAIEVHVTSANKDSIGSYHVRGEIKNLSTDTTLQFVKVIAHLNDESGQPVAVTTCCYADPNDIEPGHTSTFDSFAQKDEISGTPTSYRLSFDWR